MIATNILNCLHANFPCALKAFLKRQNPGVSAAVIEKLLGEFLGGDQTMIYLPSLTYFRVRFFFLFFLSSSPSPLLTILQGNKPQTTHSADDLFKHHPLALLISLRLFNLDALRNNDTNHVYKMTPIPERFVSSFLSHLISSSLSSIDMPSGFICA